MNRPLEANKILIVGVNWLGDSLFLLPFISSLRDNFKNSFIAIMTVPRVKELFIGNPDLNEVIIYDEKGRDKSLFRKLNLINDLKKKNFDVVFIPRPSFSRTLICWLSGISKRIGFGKFRGSSLLTEKINPPENLIHRIDQNLKILEDMGLTIKDRVYHFSIKDSDRNYINNLLLEMGVGSDNFIIINAGGNWPNKRWPLEFFARLCDKIIDELNVKIVFSGAERDIELVNKIQGLTKNKNFLLCGRTNFGQLAALMEKALIVISADSGPMHVAASAGTKVIALFGPTSPLVTGPYPLDKHIILQLDVGCKTPCYVKGCSNIRCMSAIKVEDVFESIKRALNK